MECIPTFGIKNRQESILCHLPVFICFGGDSYWDMRLHAFIDLDENPVKYRCIGCMIKHLIEPLYSL